MAIYHFSAKVISRATGRSAVAAAAYRSASRLHDKRLDRHHDFSNKAGVVHSEVILPEGAPERLTDREKLWNEVEAAEKRIDAQLAREIEFAIPREMNEEQGIALARDFVRREFVDRGMIADLNVHWDMGADGPAKPHAHVMLTMREVNEDGFGAKVRDWNRTDLLQHWREAWGEHVNQRLAELDIDASVDHRSLEAQGIDLEPQHKIGPAASRMAAQGLESERLEEHRDIARRNGERIIANPAIALDAITHNQATFTRRDLAMFVHRHSDGKDQFDQVMVSVRGSPELVTLGRDGHDEERFTSRAMIETEQRLERAVDRLAGRSGHGLPAAALEGVSTAAGSERLALGGEQQAALAHITRGSDLAIVVGYAGTGKSAMLGVARDEWECAGYRVQGLALSGIAAENLESGSGIASRTIASIEHQWRQDRDLLTTNDVLVIDEAGMIGTRQMERVIAEAEKRGAKLVLVGDPEQLQAIEAGAAFRSIAERHGAAEITEIRRQHEGWQRDATRQLATGRTGEAIRAYEERGMIHAAAAREDARTALVDRWDRERLASPDASRIILTHTRDEVRELNQAARGRLKQAGQLGEDVRIQTEHGARDFASCDRIMFLKNERGLGVKNGSLGRIESVNAMRMSVLLDDGRSVSFDIKDYAHVNHGYAATIHKAQGVTVDRAHVLATPGLDLHAAYVALSRHREGVQLHYGQDDFADQSKLVRTLSRERAKDMASDYARAFADRREIRLPHSPAPTPSRDPFADFRPPPNPMRDIGGNARPRDMFAGLDLPRTPLRPAPERSPGVIEPPALRPAVQRYAGAIADIMRMRAQGFEALPHQQSALEKARDTLDAIRPGAVRDLRSAFTRDMVLVDEAAGGNTARAIKSMTHETQVRTVPRLRADRFVEGWQELRGQRHAMEHAGDYTGVRRVGQQMAGMAKSLERDAQVESLLRPRAHELGLEWRSGKSLSHDLQDWLGISRGRGIGR